MPKIVPDIAIPPGELLAEELEVRGMTQLDLATLMERPPRVISEIVRGRKAITPRTAIEIEQALGSPASGSASKRSTASPSPGNRSRERQPPIRRRHG